MKHPVGGRDGGSQESLPSRAALFLILGLLVVSTPACRPPPVDQERPNHPPHIETLFATVNGQRIRQILPNANVVVVARVNDPDDDRIDYEWTLAGGGGTLADVAGESVTWNVGSGDSASLYLVVRDGRGGVDRAEISVSTDTLFFGGRVVTPSGEPVAGAEVEANGDRTRTGPDGEFRLPVTDPDAPRFLVSIRMEGYGLLSQVYGTTVPDGEWLLRHGTTVTADPTRPIVVQDVSSAANCTGPPATQIDWSRYPREGWPQIFNADGERLDIPYPAELQRARDLLAAGTPCAAGLTVRFGANVFVNAGGNPPPGNVTVTVSTVDLYTPQSMPGDYSVRQPRTTAGYMESFGAGDVTVTAEGELYRLRPGAEASIEIPIDSLRFRTDAPLDSVVPFLSYDEAAGVWIEDGVARLSVSRDAYVADLTHLSAFNMDLIKTNQSCVRFESSLLPQDYDLQITIPQGNAPPVVRTESVNQASETVHAIYNLPNNTWIELLPMVTVGSNVVPIGTFVVSTMGPQTPSTPNRPSYDYQACNGRVTLTDQVGPIALSYNGAGHVHGPRPLHPYTLTNAAGTDIYPVGAGELYLFGIFDTGSSIVLLSDLLSGGVPVPNTDADLLNVRPYSPNQATDPDLDVRIRIAGLDEIDPATLFGPINPPGSSYGADVELTGLRIGPRDFAPTLIGAPVTTRVVAEMDNTTILSRGPYSGVMVDGPDIRFHLPGSSSIPVPTVKLPLVRFGVNTPSLIDNASTDHRVFLRNVTFTNGSNTVSDDQSVAIPRQFMFDTGAPITVISTDVANVLAIPWTPVGGGTEDCWNTRPGNEGFEITSLEITSLDITASGSYTIGPVVVCVDVDGSELTTQYPNPSPPPAGRIIDGIIGLNVFDHVPILVNVPDGYLGILP